MNEADRNAITVASSLMLVAARIIPVTLHLLLTWPSTTPSPPRQPTKDTPLHAVNISVLMQLHVFFIKTRFTLSASRKGMLCTLEATARHEIKAASHSLDVWNELSRRLQRQAKWTRDTACLDSGPLYLTVQAMASQLSLELKRDVR